AELPVDLVPGGLNFLGDLDRLAAVEDVQAGAVSDHYPIFADADSAGGRRAETAGDFRDGPQRGLVGAVVLGGEERMLLHEVETFAQFEGGANGLAIVFSDAEQAVDAVVAFGIFDAAGAHERSVERLGGGENFDGVDVKLTVLCRG